MLFFNLTPKITTKNKLKNKKFIFIPLALMAFILFPVSSAAAVTLHENSITAVTTVSAASAANTSTMLTAAEKAAIAKAKAVAKKAAIKAKKKAKAKAYRAQIVKIAKKNRGVRYTYGGASPAAGFDCSGFTKYVYNKAAKVNLPHSANAQSKLGKKISKKNAKAGDLVIYSYPFSKNFHVAIYLDKTHVIHAKKPGFVTQIGALDWGGSETRTYVDVIDSKVGL